MTYWQASLRRISITTPNDITLDSLVNMYITNGFPNPQIIKLSPAGLPLAVIPGTTTIPPMINPFGITLDQSNNMFIADNQANTVFQLNAMGAQNDAFNVSSQVMRAAGPTGVALDPFGNIFVTDTTIANLVELTKDGLLLTIVNTSSLPLNTPDDVTLDAQLSIYIVDAGSGTGPLNGRVIKLASNGTLLDIFTTSNPSMRVPCSVVLDSYENVYVADQLNNRVVQFSPNGTLLAVYQTSNPSLLWPCGVAVDGSGNIYVADTGNARIVKFLAPAAPNTESSNGLSIGLIAAIVVVSGVFVAILAGIAIYRHHRQSFFTQSAPGLQMNSFVRQVDN